MHSLFAKPRLADVSRSFFPKLPSFAEKLNVLIKFGLGSISRPQWPGYPMGPSKGQIQADVKNLIFKRKN